MILNIFKKKKVKRSPYADCNKLTINKSVKHQKIGGKTGYIVREVTIDEVLDKLLDYNIAAMNFAKRRPDLFRDFEDLNIPNDKIVKRQATFKYMKYYYVKVEQTDGINSTYLGYFVASDEVVLDKDNKTEGRWI